eukprot:6198549-Pleurochrysis_carterae.AAC.4
MSSPRPSSLALAAATARSKSAAQTPRISSSSPPAGLAKTGKVASRAPLMAAFAAARVPDGITLVAWTTARAVSCSAESSWPAARAPASARAAARDIACPAHSPWVLSPVSPIRRATAAAAAGSVALPGSHDTRSTFGRKSSPKAVPVCGRLRTPADLSPLGGAIVSNAACAGTSGRARSFAPSGTRNSIAEPAKASTIKSASPPAFAGSHRRSLVASSCALVAAPTASRRNCHARFVSVARCALMPSAAAKSVMTAS